MKKLLIIILFIFITNNFAAAALPSSARKLATSGISSSLYDTFDKIVSKPQALPYLKGTHLILFPSILIDDIYWLSTLLSGSKESKLNGVFGLGFGNGSLGGGVYFNYSKLNQFSGNPSYNKTLTTTDNDSDNITAETNEFQTTTISESTNMTGNNNIDFGGGFGFSRGTIAIGLGFNGYIDETKGAESISHTENYTNRYSSTNIGNKTITDTGTTNITTKKQYDILANFKLYSLNNNKYSSLFLLETKFSIINEEIKNRYSYLNTINMDPNSTKNSKYFSKIDIIGDSTGTIPSSATTNFSGYKLYVYPKFYFPSSDKTKKLSIQGKFGMGLSLKKDISLNYNYSINIYSTTNNANFQDNSITSAIVDLTSAGDTSYYLYGFKLTQMFRPKYFKAGIAIDTTIEQETTSLSGTYTTTTKQEYITTSTSKTLYSAGSTPARTVTTEQPTHTLTSEIKSYKTTVSLPLGFEFTVSDKIKLRTGYTYKYVNTYTETTTEDKTSETEYLTTTDYDNPAITDTTSTNHTASRSDETTTTVSSSSTTYNILTMGIELALSKMFIINIGGYYDISNQSGKFIADSKIKF